MLRLASPKSFYLTPRQEKYKTGTDLNSKPLKKPYFCGNRDLVCSISHISIGRTNFRLRRGLDLRASLILNKSAALFEAPLIMLVLIPFAASLIVMISCLLLTLRKRNETKGLPQPPGHWLLGHMLVMASAIARFPADIHFHHVINYIQQKYRLPSIWYLDLWPLGPRFVMVNDPVIASRYGVSSSCGHSLAVP
jgi:hypothetical protein